MALARASRIQEKLNSNELKSDVPIWKHSQAVLNCFKRALEIDGSNLSLWIEYGTISYALHSFASRQLKQWRNELPPEVVKQVRGALTRAAFCCCSSLFAVGICQTPCVNQTMSHPVTSASTCEFIVELIDLSPRAELLMTAPLCACVVSDGRKERLHVGDSLPVFPGCCPL